VKFLLEGIGWYLFLRYHWFRNDISGDSKKFKKLYSSLYAHHLEVREMIKQNPLQSYRQFKNRVMQPKREI